LRLPYVVSIDFWQYIVEVEMIFYLTSAMVSDKTFIQVDADILLFLIVYILNRQIFRCDFCLKLEILKILKNQQVGPGQWPGGRRATARGAKAPEAPAF